jgi:hypothetical protein
MKTFDTITFDFQKCRKEVASFDALLKKSPVLGERKTILPFFRNRPHLSALCGLYNPYLLTVDRIAWEYELFGDFQCDLVVGNWTEGYYCFIEFEDAKPKSLFEQAGKKATREWSRRFDHGYSQLADWFYKLADRRNSDDYAAKFNKRSISFDGVLVIGRDSHMDYGERLRLEWRREHMILDSKRIHCVTFDELLSSMKTRLTTLELLAHAE